MDDKAPQPKAARVRKQPASRRKLDRSLLVVLSIVALILVITAMFGVAARRQTNKNKRSAINTKCPDALLKEASGLLSDTPQKIQPVITKIQANNGYDTDVNCLNIVTTYYISIGDIENSVKYLTQLNAIYNPAKGFDRLMGTNIKDQKTLQNEVEFMQQAQKQFQTNSQLNNNGGSRR